MEDLVSVIIPAYNRAPLLYECIHSVYRQTYRPVELVIVDDGSTDDTADVVNNCIAKLSGADFSILFLQQGRKGAPSARNIGFLNSKGNYIQFLDSDDLLLPHKLRNEVGYIKENGFDLVYSKAQFVDENLSPIEGKAWGNPLTGTELDYFNLSWQTMCALYRRESIIRTGLWAEELTINQDWEFSIRYILADLKIGFIDSCNSLFRIHSMESIGKNFYLLDKIEGKELSTKMIRESVIRKNRLSPHLDQLFFKRLIFCALAYGSIKAETNKKDLLQFICRNFKNLTHRQKLFLRLLDYSNHRIDKSLLMSYMRFIS